VTESTDGSTSNALLREKSNYAATGGTTSKQPPKKLGGRDVQFIDPDSPGHLSEAASTPSESPGGTWTDPTAGMESPAGFVSPKTDAATSPAGMPGAAGAAALVPLRNKNTIDPLSKLDSRRTSTEGGVEGEILALRLELVSQRKATEALKDEMRSMKSQLTSQLANVTHILMLQQTGTGGTASSAEASPGGESGVDGPSPAVGQRVRTKSGKDRGRRMSLNALTTAGV